MKILKGLFSAVLMIALFIELTVLITLTVIQVELKLQEKPRLLSIEKVYAEEIDAEKIANVDISQITPDLIHQYADQELENRNIPKEALDYILNEGDYQQIFEDYKQQCIDYVSGKGEEPQLPMEKINSMIDSGIANYNAETNNNINVENVQEQLTEVTTKIDENVKKIGENNTIATAFKLLGNKTITLGIGIITLITIGLILVINGVKKSMLLSSIPVTLSGISLIVIKQILDIEKLNTVKSLLGNQYSGIQSSLNLYGVVLTIVGIVLLVVSIILLKKKKVEK